MQSFNPELKVGMQAMVIGVRHEKNAGIIGKIVTIEDLCGAGHVPDGWYEPQFTGKQAESPWALVTGIGHSGGHRRGCATIKQKYLMPLPPLDDDAIIFANENVKETSKC